MIRKLRIKFILLSMFSLLLVLMVIMGTVSVLNYRKIVANADSTLAILRENGGRFPKPDKSIGDWEKGPKGISPELPYESRYFSVRMDAFGMVISADTGKIAAVDTATAMEFAQTVWEEGKEKGFVGEYRVYQLLDIPSGTFGRADSSGFSFRTDCKAGCGKL